MAAPASSSPLAPIPPDWPHSGSNDVLRTLFLQCVDGYIAEAGNDVDWPLVARASAAMRLRSRRREPREWIRFLLRSRATHGEFHQLVRDMRLDDGSDFFRYFRMTRQRFDHLLSLVGPLLQKKATFFREPISPAERLSFTIRCLAHGSSQQLASMCYRIGRSTASNILRETCWALHHVLDPLYRPVSISVLLLCADLMSYSVGSFSSLSSRGGLLVHVEHNGALLMSVQAAPKSTLKLKHLLSTHMSTVKFSTLVVFVTVFNSYSVDVASEGRRMTIVAHLSAAGAVIDKCCDSCADVSYSSAS
ncbi:unnamed protein product [Ixodes persulcatus]